VQWGFTAGAHDLIIAATAISLDYTVITANWRDFVKIEGLRLEVRQGRLITHELHAHWINVPFGKITGSRARA